MPDDDDPPPACDHEWVSMGSWKFCKHCGVTVDIP
jgi:hypothetical protein